MPVLRFSISASLAVSTGTGQGSAEQGTTERGTVCVPRLILCNKVADNYLFRINNEKIKKT